MTKPEIWEALWRSPRPFDLDEEPKAQGMSLL